MASYMGLYYPFMQFTDDAWIKLAALYWDKLGRIVPKQYEPPNDSATVKLLTEELGFVKNLYPTVRDLEIVSNMFLEVLDKHRETLIRYYGIHAQSSSDLPKEVTLSELSEEEEGLLRMEHIQKLLLDKRWLIAIPKKISKRLSDELMNEQLMKISSNKNDPLYAELLRTASDKNDPLYAELLRTASDKKLLLQVLAHKGDIQTQQKLLEKHSRFFAFALEMAERISHERTWRASQIVYDGRLLYAPLATDTGKTIIIHPKLAFVYLEALASQMASNRQLHLVTDDVFSHVATSGYTVERLAQALLLSEDLKPHLATPFPQTHEVETQVATIAVQSAIPRGLADIPVKKIIKFRNRYRDEMIAFQEAIHALAKDWEQLQEIEDSEALKAHIEMAYERNLKPQLNDFKKSLKSLGMDTVTGVMSVQVALPALLASTATGAGEYFHLASLNPVIVGAGAVACSIFPVIRKKQEEAKQLVRSSPVAYLLYAQEQLEPVNVATRIAQHARKMLFRV